jgi:hypothetical protein
MVCHRVQPGTPAISYKLITTFRLIALLPYCPIALPRPGTRRLVPDTRYRIRSDAEDRTPSTEDRSGHWKTHTSGTHPASCILHPASRIAVLPYCPIALLPYCLTAFLTQYPTPGTRYRIALLPS